jgi:hypothetical protein
MISDLKFQISDPKCPTNFSLSWDGIESLLDLSGLVNNGATN